MMRRYSRLNENFPALRPAPGTPGNLAQQLKASLGRAKVGTIDSDIRIDDTYERDVREVQPLCDHLRSKQNVDAACGYPIEYLRMRPLPARGIDIHARNARGGKPIAHETLDLLSAEPAVFERLAAASLAARAQRLLMRAVMAEQSLGRAVQSQSYAAVRTCDDVTAVVALNER
jgi:hypothetical protein